MIIFCSTMRLGLVAFFWGVAGIMMTTLTMSAEIELQSTCRPAGPVVTLGDLADVDATNPAEAHALASVELFPSPPPGEQRFVRVREIQDRLLARGFNLVEHFFSGASQVTVQSGAAATPPKHALPAVRPLSRATAESARRKLGLVLTQYLEESASRDEPWNVEVDGKNCPMHLVHQARAKLSVRGGTAPWLGRQRFEVTVPTPNGPVSFPVDAEVSLPDEVVVATRTLPRGTVVGTNDVRLARLKHAGTSAKGFVAIDEVVGRQTTQMIATGKPFVSTSVRMPILVRRGEVVTVFARSPGIRVRSVAWAREEGGRGDLITVEAIKNRKTFLAHVCGVQEVEVFARSIRTAPAAADVSAVNSGQ